MKLAIRVAARAKDIWTAYCPELPGCVSQGATREEATAKLMEVVRGYLAAVSNFVPDNIECEYRGESPLNAGGVHLSVQSGAGQKPSAGKPHL